MMLAVQFTPATPAPLLPTAPMVPATCVPWSLSSLGSHGLGDRVEPVRPGRAGDRSAADRHRERRGGRPHVGREVGVGVVDAGVDDRDDVRARARGDRPTRGARRCRPRRARSSPGSTCPVFNIRPQAAEPGIVGQGSGRPAPRSPARPIRHRAAGKICSTSVAVSWLRESISRAPAPPISSSRSASASSAISSGCRPLAELDDHLPGGHGLPVDPFELRALSAGSLPDVGCTMTVATRATAISHGKSVSERLLFMW